MRVLLSQNQARKNVQLSKTDPVSMTIPDRSKTIKEIFTQYSEDAIDTSGLVYEKIDPEQFDLEDVWEFTEIEKMDVLERNTLEAVIRDRIRMAVKDINADRQALALKERIASRKKEKEDGQAEPQQAQQEEQVDTP